MWSLLKWSKNKQNCQLYRHGNTHCPCHFESIQTVSAAGFDPEQNRVHFEASPTESEEWLLLMDQTNQSHQRAVVIKNKHSGRFLAVQNGSFTGLTSYSEDCKWLLE